MKLMSRYACWLLLLLLASFRFSSFSQTNSGGLRSPQNTLQNKTDLEAGLARATTDTARARYTLALAVLSANTDFPEAERLGAKAIQLAESDGENEYLVRAYMGVAQIYYANNRIDRSLELLKAGWPYAEETNDLVFTANYAGRLGQIYQEKGMYEKALEYYRRSLQLLLATNEHEDRIAVRYLNIGNVLERMDKFPEAIDNLKSSIEINKTLQYWDRVGGGYHNLAEIYLKLNETEMAETAFEQARQYTDRSKKKAISHPQPISKRN